MPLDATGFVNDPQIQNDWWVLICARDLLSRRGNWCKRAYHIPGGGYCTVGAVYEVLNRSTARSDSVADDIIRRRLYPCLPPKYHTASGSPDVKVSCVMDYNDESRRKGDVLRLFDRALADLSHIVA